MFDLKLLPEHKIVQVNNDGKRHYEVDGEVVKFDSVTTFLGRYSDKESLELWRHNVGDAEADRIANEARVRGNIIHSYLERFVLGEQFEPIECVDNYNAIKKCLVDNLSVVYGIEYKMYSKDMLLAGTTDLIGVYNGKLSIIDFKGSNKIKRLHYIDNYVIQTLIYAKMLKELHGMDVEQLVILIAVDGVELAQEFVIPKSKFVYYERELGYKFNRRAKRKNDE